jgi:hypothetical protein
MGIAGVSRGFSHPWDCHPGVLGKENHRSQSPLEKHLKILDMEAENKDNNINYAGCIKARFPE